MYSFSLDSSSTDAYGKAALNMPVALMYPSLDRLCRGPPISTYFSHLIQFSESYHQKVGLWVFPVRSLDEDAARAQVAGKRHAQVRIVEDTEVIRLGRVRSANLARLDFQFGLSETAALDKDLIYSARMVSLDRLAVNGGRIKESTYGWARVLQPAWGSCPREECARRPLCLICRAIALSSIARV
jgi:hypothetical protein